MLAEESFVCTEAFGGVSCQNVAVVIPSILVSDGGVRLEGVADKVDETQEKKKEEKNMDISYLDLDDQPAELSQEELNWFFKVCEECQEATGIRIQIQPADHEKRKGKGKEALGTLHTKDPDNIAASESMITIDNYFIHECFEEKFHGQYNLSFETLEHVIAHEFAHLYQWRHCKRHERLTEELFEKIKRYQEKTPQKFAGAGENEYTKTRTEKGGAT